MDEIKQVDANNAPLEEYNPAPEIFIDGITTWTTSAGVVKMNCFSNYVDASGTNRRRIVCRLTMPVVLVPAVRDYFSEVVGQMMASGVIIEGTGARKN